MRQARLALIVQGRQARALFRDLEARFEEEGWPLALTELDEKSDTHEISVYVDADDAGAEAQIREAVDGHDVVREDLADIDWVSASLEGLKPVRAGRFLVHGAHDRAARRPGEIAIEIEAGLAFGTGHHGTTAGCLEMIGQVMRRENPTRLLDLGTGSAVLAIAMARLARRRVLATDIDPVAVRVAQDNARLNQAGAFVRAVTATGFDHPAITAAAPFDLIVANILAKPLMRLAPAMRNHVWPGGSVILSGILVRQRAAVVAAYIQQGFRTIRVLTRGDWVTIHLKR